MNEVYKEIKNHKGYYVSNLGNVKKVNQNKERKISVNPVKQTVRFTRDGVSKSYKVSTLVAAAFLEDADGRRKIRHKDGNTKNNCASNLEYVGLTRTQVKDIKLSLLEGKSMGQMARKYGVERTFIRKIRDGEVWKDVEPDNQT